MRHVEEYVSIAVDVPSSIEFETMAWRCLYGVLTIFDLKQNQGLMRHVVLSLPAQCKLIVEHDAEFRMTSAVRVHRFGQDLHEPLQQLFGSDESIVDTYPERRSAHEFVHAFWYKCCITLSVREFDNIILEWIFYGKSNSLTRVNVDDGERYPSVPLLGQPAEIHRRYMVMVIREGKNENKKTKCKAGLSEYQAASLAGGYKKNSDKKRIYIYRANGTTERGGRFDR